jgi:LuxR family transcriptional regulator, maltose regulon positive regulatory protein
MGFGLAAADVSALEAHTEGWIAGLHLAALRLASPETGRDDRSSFIRDFTGSNALILDYLVEEVLHRQSEDVQTFLKQTSVLGRLCGPLCDALTGPEDLDASTAEPHAPLRPSSERAAGQAMLERLQQANLFISPLDEERSWYRYHHLFAEVLRVRLQIEEPDLLPVLHRRASTWFEHQGRNAEAIDHALAGADFAHAARLIEQVAAPTIGGEKLGNDNSRAISRAGAGTHAGALVESLSDRELQVVALLARDLSNAEIAGQLYVSPETVKVHLKHIYGKLAVNSRRQAVTRARDLSLL